jgi:hypothetical protein
MPQWPALQIPMSHSPAPQSAMPQWPAPQSATSQWAVPQSPTPQSAYPRPAVPPPGAWLLPPAPPEPPRITPGQVAAGIATGVLCLWTPFTLIIGFLLATLPDCANSAAMVCTPAGRLYGIWLGTGSALLGLAVVVICSWIRPRRDHGYWALIGLAVAAAGFLLTLGLANGAPEQ